MQTAFIGLGSNLGDTLENLFQARTYLKKVSGLKPGSMKYSRVYFTEPQGIKDQPWFANQVLSIECEPSMTPIKLLEDLLLIEKLMGRKREKCWGPRIIDLDLLLFGQQESCSESLTLPHPEITKRAFVLIPLLEINPDLTLPGGNLLKEYLQQLAFEIQDDKIWQE